MSPEPDDFDPAADGRANYLEALKEIRRRKVEAGELAPTEQERQLGEPT